MNEGCCSYFDFAWEVGHQLGLPDSRLTQLIEPVMEDVLRQDAPRPPHTPMRCLESQELGFAPLPVWPLALAEYINDDLH